MPYSHVSCGPGSADPNPILLLNRDANALTLAHICQTRFDSDADVVVPASVDRRRIVYRSRSGRLTVFGHDFHRTRTKKRTNRTKITTPHVDSIERCSAPIGQPIFADTALARHLRRRRDFDHPLSCGSRRQNRTCARARLFSANMSLSRSTTSTDALRVLEQARTLFRPFVILPLRKPLRSTRRRLFLCSKPRYFRSAYDE